MYRRIFAMLLVFVMVFSLLPGAAMATDEAPETEPAATEAQETEPAATEAQETEPKETEPAATEAQETEPKETEPKETEPKATEPKATEPKATEPKATEPKATEPKATEPKATEPAATEPKATEPQATEPAATEPQATQPAATEPAPDQKIKFTNPGKRNAEELATVKVRFSFEFPEDSGLPGDKELSSYIQLTSGLPDNPTRYVAPGIPEEDDTDRKVSYSFLLPANETYAVEILTVDFEGYHRVLVGDSEIDLIPGDNGTKEYTVRYLKDEEEDENTAKLSIALTFAKNSALDGDDIESITAGIYNAASEELAGTLVLNKENEWKGQLTVPAEEDGSISYSLKFSGYEQDGYTGQLTGADYTIEPLPGEEAGWNAIARYVKESNKVTVKVRLSEDSDMSADDLRENVVLCLSEVNDGMVSKEAYHTGSEVFTYAFTDLPASDCYRLGVDYGSGDITVQSFTCTGDVKYENLEDGQLDFALNGDCEIEVVLLAKEPKGEVTVIARFADDSILQAEDFPNGLTLTPVLGQYRESQQLGNALLVSPGNNWTAMTTITTNMLNMVVEQPDGYVGSVELSDIYGDPIGLGLMPAACPTTVYAEICFTEHEPVYLDVEFVFAEDSALKGADAGNIYLDVSGSTNDRIEFSEQSGWKRTLELYGTYNGFVWDRAYGFAVSGLDRPGYSYSLEKDGVSLQVGAEDSVEWCDMGARKELIITVRYTRLPNALVVNITSSPHGYRPDSTIVVEDADGNIVAEKSGWDAQQIIELSEAGYYTVRLVKEESTGPRIHLIDEEKTIYFDPAVGACVTFLNEFRDILPLKLRKYFTEDSELGPNDFPEGIKVTLTEATGAFSGTYTLSDANGWQMDVNVPAGSYTVTETEADKEGYERTTEYTFHYWGGLGGASLRGWSNRADSEGTGETVTDMTGGPFCVRSQTEMNEIFIYNTYVSDRTGSIIINAGDGFWRYGGEQLPGSLGTGYEVEAYQYLVNIDGEEQTVTLKPGETFELDGLAEGTEYTVTPIPPEGYAWNTDVTPITGTIGGGDEDSWNAEVSFENDYYYTYEDGTLTVVKTDALTDETLKGAKFGLYNDKDCTEQVATATTNKDGICSFTLSEEGTYYLKELKAPEDYYEKSEEVKTVTVTGEWKLETREGTKVLVQKLTASVAGLPQKDGGYVWENERKVTDISVTKKFAYDEDLERPDSVTVVLYQDDEAYETVKLSEANDWTYVWEDMPLGFEYAVDELNVAKGYYKQIRSSGYDFTVVNSGAWIPQTGDESQMMFWCAGAMLSLCAIVFLTEKKRRQRV